MSIRLLFTGFYGDAYGYQDEFRDDGILWYTGEGQKGDMRMVRGNKTVRDHSENGKILGLFEEVSEGHVRFIGWAICFKHHYEERPDVDGSPRRARVFELAVYAESSGSDSITEDDVAYSTDGEWSGYSVTRTGARIPIHQSGGDFHAGTFGEVGKSIL